MGEEVVNCVVVASEAHEATVSENNTVNDELATEGAVEDVPMELETPQNANKRARDEDPQEDNDNGDDQSKKQRVEESGGSQQNGAEKSVEETRLIEKDAQEADERKGDAEVDDGSLKEKEGGENGEGDEQKGGENEEGDEQNEGVVVGDDGKANEEEEEEKQKVGPVKLGPKVFNTSKEMFDYFYKFMHHWPLNLGVNKYEHMVLRELLLQGHHEPDKKVGSGIEAFQIRVHPMFQSRCYFLIRKDGSMDDFSYRKCVDSLLPLPENMRTSGNNLGSHGQKNNRQSKQGQGGWGGGRGGGGGGGNRGGGRGGWHGGGHGRHGSHGRHGGRGRGGRGRS